MILEHDQVANRMLQTITTLHLPVEIDKMAPLIIMVL